MLSDTLSIRLAGILLYHHGRYECLSNGRHRMTFRVSSTEIVKVPLNENGIFDNGYEAKIFCERGRDGFIPYARCELDTIDEIPVLKMEFVDVGSAPKFSEAPGWVDYVDCGQVGTALDGKLVAYDYGYF